MEKNGEAEETRKKFDAIDKSHDTQAKEIVDLNNRNLSAQSHEGRSRALCTRCGNILKHKSHGYCETCADLRNCGKIPARPKAEPNYSQRKCKCGTWFPPTDAATKKCRQCKEKDMADATTKPAPRRVRRYSPESKALFVRKVNEFRLKGMNAEEAYAKAGALALGAQGNSFNYYTWRKQLKIETPVELTKKGESLRANRITGLGKPSPYDDEKRMAFLEDVDRRIAKGASKALACQLAGKAILDKSMAAHTYRDWNKALRRDLPDAGPHTKAKTVGGPRSEFTEQQRRDFVAEVTDMRSRGIDMEEASNTAGLAILGVTRTAKQYQNYKSGQTLKDKKAAERAGAKMPAKQTEPTPKPRGDMSLSLAVAWLAGVDDADTLISLQDALDVRKAIVHKQVEEEAERLLTQLSRLTTKQKNLQPKLEPSDVLHAESGNETSQAE